MAANRKPSRRLPTIRMRQLPQKLRLRFNVDGSDSSRARVGNLAPAALGEPELALTLRPRSGVPPASLNARTGRPEELRGSRSIARRSECPPAAPPKAASIR